MDSTKPKLRIFGVLNHIGHQYEMVKLAQFYPVEFTYLKTFRDWDTAIRPLPKSLAWTNSFDQKDYDFVILHVDQRTALPKTKYREIFDVLARQTKGLPRIIVNHGTPMISGASEDFVIESMKGLIGGDTMIVNSFEAAKRWGFGTPIIHGMDSAEWLPLKKKPVVVTQISPGLGRYHGIPLLDSITGLLRAKGIDVVNIGTSVLPKDWDEQRRFLGEALLYVNTTLDSPMPRGRTEAMFCECCVLTTPFHDAARFIENGETGFILDGSSGAWVELIEKLLSSRFDQAVSIGEKARASAVKNFSLERYLADLWKVITSKHARPLI